MSTLRVRIQGIGYRVGFSLLVIAVLLSGHSSQLAVAADPPVESGQGLEISPPVIELSASPGQVLSAEIKIRNVTKTPLIVRGKVNDFVAGGEEGQPKLLLEDNQTSSYSLVSWPDGIPTLQLPPGQVKTAVITLRVPSGASPGGHYGVIRFTGVPPELEDTGVALSASIGTLLLVNVSGAVTEEAKFEEFFVSRRGQRGGLFESGPLVLTERIRNVGNVHVKPTGELKIAGLFGRQVATLKVNDPARNVLPDSVRKFEQTLDKKFLFGRYRATANLTYGQDKTLVASQVFWVIPYKLLALLLLVLVIVFFVLRSGLKGYNRRIIERSRRR